MSFTLDDRAALRRAFWLLTGSESGDDALTEHDAETNENAHRAIQTGLWNAQRYLCDIGAGDRWYTVSSVLSFSGSDDTGGTYAALPERFLRVAGDRARSALREANGTPWGTMLDSAMEAAGQTGAAWYLRGESVWLLREASPPASLYLHHYQRHATLSADDTAVDFPEECRELIVAEAAYHAMHQNWLPGGGEMQGKIDNARRHWRTEAAQALRRTSATVTMADPWSTGTRWFLS